MPMFELLPPEAIKAGAKIDWKNGNVTTITGVEDGEILSYDAQNHPVIAEVGAMLQELAGDMTFTNVKWLEVIAYLNANVPGLEFYNFAAIVAQCMPWPVTIVNEALKAGLPFNPGDFPGMQQIVVAPHFDLNVKQAAQAAPVIEFKPEINLPAPLPPPPPPRPLQQKETREVTHIERDSNGFILRTTKVREPVG